MTSKSLLIVAFGLLSALSINAQSPSKVTGQINDNTGKPIAAATVMLHSAKDSSLKKTAVSDSKGYYELLTIKPGRYFLTTSVVNMQKTASAAFDVKEGETFTAPTIA